VVCAQCNADDERIWVCGTVEGDVPLHRECVRHWIRRFPQPNGRPVCAVHISSRPPETLGPRDDNNLADIIDARWR
jgi:hypothetical protein